MPAPMHHAPYSSPQLGMADGHEGGGPQHYVSPAAVPDWGQMAPPPAQARASFRRPVSAFSAAAHNGMPVSQPLLPPQHAMTAPNTMSADLSMDLSWDLPKLPSLLMDAEMLSTSPDKLPGDCLLCFSWTST